jgi:two-component system LytT family response regulator/two-component system response regulator LytT
MILLRRIFPVLRVWLFAGAFAGMSDDFLRGYSSREAAAAWSRESACAKSHENTQLPAHASFAYTQIGLHQMPINTIIVDDEKPARDELVFLLKGFPEINIIGQGKNGVEAVALIKEHAPDLVFLDVQMPGLDGFAVLKKLVERKMKVPHVVFATAFDQYAVKAFDVNAVDYVLKPFDKARIAKAIQRARKMMESDATTTERLEQLVNQLESSKQTASPPVKLILNSQQKLLLVDAEDMIFATVDSGHTDIVARDAEGSANYRTLEELEAALDSDSFWRAHRSYLVNIHYIKEVVPWFKGTFMLKMNDKKHTQVPVGRSQQKRMRELFKL